MKIEKMKVTPEMAVKWLASNDHNRQRRKNVELSYKRQMTQNFWKLTPQPIIIGKDGTLLDGQHRLGALVQADKSLEFFVATDVPEDVFPYIDAGMKRNAADAVQIDGYQYPQWMSTFANAALLYEREKFFSTGSAANRPVPIEVLEYCRVHDEDLIQSINFVIGMSNKNKYATPKQWGTAYHLIVCNSKHPRMRVEMFFKDMHTSYPSSHSSVRWLQDQLLINKDSVTKLPRRNIYAMFFHAWGQFNRKQGIFQSVDVNLIQPSAIR